jgi:hypothetical protein
MEVMVGVSSVYEPHQRIVQGWNDIDDGSDSDSVTVDVPGCKLRKTADASAPRCNITGLDGQWTVHCSVLPAGLAAIRFLRLGYLVPWPQDLSFKRSIHGLSTVSLLSSFHAFPWATRRGHILRR